jgi:diguanylate cyclase (GGDEF)-like protein
LLTGVVSDERADAAIAGVLTGASFTDVEVHGDRQTLIMSGYPLHGPGGEITGGIVASVDITDLREAERKIAQQLVELNQAHQSLEKLNLRLEALATTDGLTGISNHRALQERLSQLIAEAERGRKFVAAMIDVDNFKVFNDDFGHQAGDEVLVSVADALRTHVRKTDFVARYGGEEFCVLFSDTDEDMAEGLCEKLRAAVEAIELPYRCVTASFGIATHNPAHMVDADVLKAADTALYVAKQNGRNRVERYIPGTTRAA